MEDFKEYVPNVRFELIPIKNLVSNQDYQRNLSQTHILRAAEHLTFTKLTPSRLAAVMVSIMYLMVSIL